MYQTLKKSLNFFVGMVVGYLLISLVFAAITLSFSELTKEVYREQKQEETEHLQSVRSRNSQ